MKKIILLSLSLLFFISCSNNKWLNTNIENNFLPKKPSLKDDFYQSVNYDSIIKPLPENSNYEDTGYYTFDKISNQMLSLLQNPEIPQNPDEALLKKVFNLFMDWDTRNANGFKSVLPLIEKIKSVQNIDDFKNLYDDKILNICMPVSIEMYTYIPCFNVKKIIYNKESSYEFYIVMMVKAGYSKEETTRLLDKIADFEKEVIIEGQENILYVYYNELDACLPELSLQKYIDSFGISKSGKVYSSCYDTLKNFNSHYNNQYIEELKAICLCNLLAYASKFTDEESYKAVKKYENKLNETKNIENYEVTTINNLNNLLPMLFGKVWIKNFFSDDIKKDVTGLTNTILNEYKNIISNWEWLSDSSRYNQISLFNNLLLRIGYDDNFDYQSGFTYFEDDLFRTAFSIVENINYESSLLNWNSYDNESWIQPPQTMNANYYMSNFGVGVINVYAGYIIASDYSVDLPIEEKFARLGVTIAHELSHSFIFYNSDGEVTNLWVSNDLETLLKKLSVLSKYLSTFEVLQGEKYNGNKVICETAAEMFGLYAILNIAQQYSDFDYDLFFRTYAQTMYFKTNEMKYYVDNYNMPVHYLRVNALLQQFNEFYQTYNINSGDKMYLSPKKRFVFSENYNELIPFSNYNYTLEIDELNINTLPQKLFSNSFYDMTFHADSSIYSLCKVDILNPEDQILNTQIIYADKKDLPNLFKEKIYTDIDSSKMVISLKLKDKEEYIQMKSFDLVPPHLKETKLVNYDKNTKITTFTIDITNIHSFPKELKPGRVYVFDIDLKDFDFKNCKYDISYKNSIWSISDDFILQPNGHFVKTIMLSESINSFKISFYDSYCFDSYTPIYAKINKNNGVDKIKIPSSYKKAQSYLHNEPDERIVNYINEMNVKDLCKLNPDRALQNCVKEINKIASSDFEKIVLINDCIWCLVSVDEDSINQKLKPEQDYRSVLKRGLAQNEGFAHLFYQMCYVANIPCFEISGFGLEVNKEQIEVLKDFDSRNQNYMWNVVMADGYWYHADIYSNCSRTKENIRSDYYSSDYLFQKPKNFLLMHYPSIPEHQLLSKPVNDRQYISYVKRSFSKNRNKNF